jgi:uncharacterized membrane protein YfcA
MMSWPLWLAGNGSTLFTGCSKTGIPGASILAVVLLANVTEDTRQSVGVLLPLLICADLFAIAFYRKHADWRLLGRLLPWTLLGLGIGYVVLSWSQSFNFQVLLGSLVMIILLLDPLQKRLGLSHIPRHPVYAALLGTAAGVTTTLGNLAGPVMSLYLLSLGLEKHRFMGSMAWFFLIINLLKVPLFVSREMITGQSLQLSLSFLPGIVVGALLGRTIFQRIPQRPFARVVQTLAGLAALRLVFLS